MSKINFYKILFVTMLILIFLPLMSYAQVPSTTFLNDSTQFTGPSNKTFLFNATGTRVNIDLSMNPVHKFEGQSDIDNANWIIEYNASNTTGYLLKLLIDDEPQIDNVDRIMQFDCKTNVQTELCTAGCGGFDFNNFNNFTIRLNSSDSTFSIFIGSSNIKRASGTVCTNATQIGNIIFAPESSVQTAYIVKNNNLTADNRAPIYIGNISNFTLEEDTFVAFNISGNFTDPDADNLKFGFVDLENITISINQLTGIVNITPPANFNGIRYVRFFANDSKNITFSNNISINVTPVNDIPTVSNVMLNNTDFLNRTNGSLIVGWTFSDIENDAQQGNETLWYINGTENLAFRNLTTINSTNTTKNQNWTFSVRIFDGTNFSIFANSTSLTIQNSAPIHTIPAITSNDEHNRKNGTLTCNNQSTVDLDSDVITNFIKWYKNNVLVDTAIDSTILNVGNYSKNDNITCEIMPNDETVNGTSLNSTNFSILNAAPLLNKSVENKTWDEGTSTTIDLNISFVDIDIDNLTYNFTSVSNIAISINNNTGIATLTSDADFNGVRNILFFAYDGTNLTSSNNVTLTVNDVPEPAPSGGGGTSAGGSGGGGGGGGGSAGGKYICELDWQCESWTECIDRKQARKCSLVKVPIFLLDNKCPQFKVPEQSRSCEMPVKETCNDGIKNQNEDGADCGGVCEPCPVAQQEPSPAEQPQNLITGAAIAGPEGFGLNSLWLILALALMLVALLLYSKFSHRRLFKKEQLSEEEMKKLNDMLSYALFKKEK